MDAFAEKDLIDCLRDIAGTLKEIKVQMEDLTLAVREMNSDIEIEEGFEQEGEEDSEEEEDLVL